MRRVTTEPPSWWRTPDGTPAVFVSPGFPIQNTPQPGMGIAHCARMPQRHRRGVPLHEQTIYHYTNGSPVDARRCNDLCQVSPSAIHHQSEVALPFDTSNAPLEHCKVSLQGEVVLPLEIPNEHSEPRKVSLPGSSCGLDSDQQDLESKRQCERIRKAMATQTFPVKLHDMLSSPWLSDLIAWMPHGRAWKVLKIQVFEERVLPLYFRSGRYSSFMRQVTGWGFRRITEGPDSQAYYHELFMRGLPQLAKQIRRPKKGELPAPIPDLLQLNRKPSPSYALPQAVRDGQEWTERAIHHKNSFMGSTAVLGYHCKAIVPERLPVEEPRNHGESAIPSSLSSLGSFEGYPPPQNLASHAIADEADYAHMTLDPPPILPIQDTSPLPLESWCEDEYGDDGFIRPALHGSHPEHHVSPPAVPVPLLTHGTCDASSYAVTPIQVPFCPVYMPLMMPDQQAHFRGKPSARAIETLPTTHSFSSRTYGNGDSIVDTMGQGHCRTLYH